MGYIQFAFSLSLAHRTSSTTSPLTAVETLFGALDVATEQVTKRLLEDIMFSVVGVGGLPRFNLLCSVPSHLATCLRC